MPEVTARQHRTGSLNFHDTSLDIWEEPDNGGEHGLPKGYEEEFTDKVLTPLRAYLSSRGFTVVPDPDGKHYQPIAHWMWVANHGDLKVKLHLGGRKIEIAFYQDVVHENPYGGRHDFRKFGRMPYLIRLRFLAEVTALIGYLTTTHGYDMPRLAGDEGRALPLRIAETARYGRDTLPTKDPLASFNDRWDGEWDRKRGEHRFKRDETGWPTKHEITYGNFGGTDAHGVYIEPGAVRYKVDYKGYILRGRCYPNMNSMCIFVYGPGPQDWTAGSSGEFFSNAKGSLRKVKGYRAAARLKPLLEQAVASQNFERAIVLRDQMKRFSQNERLAA